VGPRVPCWWVRFHNELAFRVLECRGCIARNDLEFALIRGEYFRLRDCGVEAKYANRIQNIRIDQLMSRGAFGPPDA